MINIILRNLKTTEQKKEKKVKAHAKLQQEIDVLDADIKRFQNFKKEYDKLQKNVNEFVESKKVT